MNLRQHLRRQIDFSRNTFGPGERTAGICDHIRKELKEIEAETDLGLQANEFVDAVILSLDGLWRTIQEAMPDLCDGDVAQFACDMIEMKQSTNEARQWPDWRSAEPGKAIEHVRTEE